MSTARTLVIITLASCLAGCLGGCPQLSSAERVPFLKFAETFGIGGPLDESAETAASGSSAELTFRQRQTLRLQNWNNRHILECWFVAWVEVSSVRTAEQEDALLRDGYVPLADEIKLGTAFTLPVGTFVYGGPGTAGATQVRLRPAGGGSTAEVDADPFGEQQQQEGSGAGTDDTGTDDGSDGGEDETVDPTEASFRFITPDAILLFGAPPVSCDSIAYVFRDAATDEIVDGSAVLSGGNKTLAQINGYQCSPFKPGLFFRNIGGEGVRQPNEYLEGERVTFAFLRGWLGNTAYRADITFGDIDTTYTLTDGRFVSGVIEDTGDGG